MSITLNSIQPTLHELKLGLKELYGDRNDYNLYRNQSIHAVNQLLVGQSTVIVRL
jgi:hypothetical protein